MSEERVSKGSSASSYFLVGFGLGSLIVGLFAPKSSAESRGYVSDELIEGSECAHRETHELRDQAAALDKHDENVVVRKKEQITAAVAVGREIYKQEIAKAKAARTDIE